MSKIFVSTFPFSRESKVPLDLLKKSKFEFILSPFDRKLTSEEILEYGKDCEAIIAGTTDLTLLVDHSKKLKFISRVGIGLDSIPLLKCKEKGIEVAYTPDAVTMAVAEMTIGLIINATRFVNKADKEIRQGFWNRHYGKRLEHSTIGLIGFGRIGSKVAELLSVFKPERILVNDIKNIDNKIAYLQTKYQVNIESTSKETIYKNSDIISLHLPIYRKTHNLINSLTLQKMKKDCFLLNTSRGGIVNENDLLIALNNGTIKGAALDVFENEPYNGDLINNENILLTQHMGSCSFDCRENMEVEATIAVISFLQNKMVNNIVPEEEYAYQTS